MKMLQIRNVPDDVHRRLKARAAMEGRSMSEVALRELRRSLEQPTVEELIERVRSHGPTDGGMSSVEAVEAGRAEQDAIWDRRLR